MPQEHTIRTSREEKLQKGTLLGKRGAGETRGHETILRKHTLPLSFLVEPVSVLGVNSHSLADDQVVPDQLADGETAVGHRNVAGLVGVQPHAALAAFQDRRRKALLES